MVQRHVDLSCALIMPPRSHASASGRIETEHPAFSLSLAHRTPSSRSRPWAVQSSRSRRPYLLERSTSSFPPPTILVPATPPCSPPQSLHRALPPLFSTAGTSSLRPPVLPRSSRCWLQPADQGRAAVKPGPGMAWAATMPLPVHLW
jgi:hypothetical protein